MLSVGYSQRIFFQIGYVIHKYNRVLYPFSAGTDVRRYNLTSIDVKL